MRKHWWQYESRPQSEVLQGVAWIWLVFSVLLFVIEIGEWRPASLSMAGSALAVAMWHFKSSREHAKIEAVRRTQAASERDAARDMP